MNATPDRIERACLDVVAVERRAPGLVKVVTWSDAYIVDARGEGCQCFDKEYNLGLGEHCKHRVAAELADREDVDVPTPFDVVDTLDRRVATDGGKVVEPERKGNSPEGHGQFTVADMANENAKHFESRPDADDGLEKAQGAPGVEPELFPPGESPEFLYHGDGEQESPDHIVPCDICGEDVDVTSDESASGAGRKPVHKSCVTGSDHDADSESGEDESADAAAIVDADDAPDTNHEPEVLSADEVADASDQLPDERHVDEDPIRWLPGEFVDQIDGSPAINRKGFEVLAYHYDVSVSADLEVAPEETDHEYCRVKATARMDGREVEAFGSAHVDRGDDSYLLLELAGTRSRKRALSIITGAGAVAVDELINQPEGGR